MPGHGSSQFFLNSPWTCPVPSVALGCAARAAGSGCGEAEQLCSLARGPRSAQPAAPPPRFMPTSASPIPFSAVSAHNEGNLPPRGSFPKRWERRDSRGTRYMSSETRMRHPKVSPHPHAVCRGTGSPPVPSGSGVPACHLRELCPPVPPTPGLCRGSEPALQSLTGVPPLLRFASSLRAACLGLCHPPL